MAYQSKFTGAEVDSLLEQVQKGEVGESVTVDSSLSTTSENPVMNKAITEEINKKLEGEVIGTTSPTEGTIGGARDSHNIGSIELFEQIIAERRNYNLTQEDKDAILSGKIITTSAGNGVVPTISSNSMGENGAVLIFHFNERLYEMFVMWTDTRCYINGVLSFAKETKLYADSELSETSENSVQNKVVTAKLTELSGEMEDLSGVVEEAERALNIQPTEVLLDKAFLSGYITGSGYFSTINQGTNYGLYYIPVRKGKTYQLSGMYATLQSSYAGITFCETLPTTAGNYGATVLQKAGNGTPIDYQYTADKDGYLYVFIYDNTGYVNFFGYEPKTTFDAKYIEDTALHTESTLSNRSFDFVLGEALKANGDAWTGLGEIYGRTDFIEVRGYQYLSFQLASNETITNVCLYDENKLFLRGFKYSQGLITSFIDLSEHADAKYIRCSTTSFDYYRDSGYLYVKLIACPHKPAQYKKMLNIGDSLTKTSRWAIYVCDYCYIPTYSQNATSGATMAKKGNNSIYDAVQALTAEDDVDLVTIWAGTNDFGSSIEIGDFDVQINADTRDVTTFYGAYMASVEKVLELYPKARIILIGTTPRTWGNGQGDYNTTTIGGRYLRDFVDAVKKIAEWYGLPFLDLLRTSGINSRNITEYMYPQTGGGTYYLHFSAAGTQQIAKRIAAFIESVG